MNVPFGYKTIEKEVTGETKYFPVYCLNGQELIISCQGNPVYFDTKEESDEYIKEEEL